MNTPAPQARLLRLAPKPTSGIDADMVDFTIMEFFDKKLPAAYQAASPMARVNLRNLIVRTVLAVEVQR